MTNISWPCCYIILQVTSWSKMHKNFIRKLHKIPPEKGKWFPTLLALKWMKYIFSEKAQICYDISPASSSPITSLIFIPRGCSFLPERLFLKYRNDYRIASWSLPSATHVGNAHAYHISWLQIEILASVNASPHHFAV